MTTDCVGGVWSYSLDLCAALADHGCEVLLACTGGPLPESARAEAEHLGNVQLNAAPWRLEWMDDPWDDVARAADWLGGLASDFGPDLVHLNSYGPATVDFGVPVLLVAHSCVYTWFAAVHGTEPGAAWRPYRRHVVDALQGADTVIAPTQAFLDALGHCYPEVRFRGRSDVIYHGVRAPDDDSRPPAAARYVLAVGRVRDAAMNLEQLAGAAHALPCPVFIAGQGTFARRPPGLVMLGRRSRRQLWPYYRQATVFAHPALYEPFGPAVLEAALAGCPLMLADIPGLRELWRGAARFADPHDGRDWQRQLKALLADPRQCRMLGRAARDRAARFNVPRMAARYVRHYKALLRQDLRQTQEVAA